VLDTHVSTLAMRIEDMIEAEVELRLNQTDRSVALDLIRDVLSEFTAGKVNIVSAMAQIHEIMLEITHEGGTVGA
jgi:uncharacterized protein (DUF2164 family)